MLSKAIVTQEGKTSKTKKAKQVDLHVSLPEDRSIDVAAWIRFIRAIGIAKMFSAFSDPRQQGKILYPLSSLLMWAFSACAFRAGSKNALQTSLEQLKLHQRQGMIHLLELKRDSLPHVSTVDNALSQLSLDALNQIPLDLLRQLEKRKLFYNHPELLPNNSLQVGSDGFWIHTYDHPHATHEDGTNACPYCLPRIRGKGTEKERTQWIHVTVTFALICNGITLPLYVYPLKARQIDVGQSDERLKEECELVATHAILPLLRERFPRLAILFLGDALYANRTTIRLCNELKIDYVIVFKESPLKNLNRYCNELSKTEFYQKYYRHRVEEHSKRGTLQKEVSWFNQADAGEGVVTHVLRYQENQINGEGNAVIQYRGAWICSKKVSKENCLKRVQTGRSRWDHEDLHNTMKNRGFDTKHDMARTNPHLLFVWKILNFIAYFVFALFQHTSVAGILRGSRSLKKFAQDLLQQLMNRAWETISQSRFLQQERVQFRYRFNTS